MKLNPDSIPLSDPCRRCDRFTVGRTLWANLGAKARRWATSEGHRRRGPRGLCSACYQYVRDHDQLDDWPVIREQVPAAVMLEDYQLIRPDLPGGDRRLRLAVAADRMGTTVYALEKALERAGMAA